MSMRGLFYQIFPESLIKNEKKMFVRCLETKVVSFDFILNDKGYNENMKKNILNLEEKYTNYSDRTMVYFICVRKKVRFVAKKDNIKNISFSLYKDDIKMLATIENNHYESGENHQKKSKRKSHYYNNSKGSTIVLANNAQKIGANE